MLPMHANAPYDTIGIHTGACRKVDLCAFSDTGI